MAIAQWQDANQFDVLRNIINQLVTKVNSMVDVPVGSIMEYNDSYMDPALWDTNGVGIVNTQYERFAFCLGQTVTGSLMKNADGFATNTTPDRRGKFAVGRQNLHPLFNIAGNGGGDESITLTANQSGLRQHDHDYTNPTKGGGGAVGGSGVWLAASDRTSGVVWVDNVLNRDGPQNALEAHNNLPPYMVTNFIVRFK